MRQQKQAFHWEKHGEWQGQTGDERRTALLERLRKRPGKFTSGEELAQELGLSRTAVWKQVEALRRKGYVIEAKARAGYRLLQAPDRLYPEELAPHLGGLRLGRVVFYRERVDSTMELARVLAEEGAPEGTLVVAEAQERGRGRLGRPWASPLGLGLWFSLVLRPTLVPAQAAKVTLLAAVAGARAVEMVTRLAPGIKWPNDLYLQGRKVAGILTELKGQADAVDYLILGVGINVNQQEKDFPLSLRHLATSLYLAGGERVDRVRLLATYLREFEHRYDAWQGGSQEDWLREWHERNITLGRPVRVSFLAEHFRGVALALDSDGGLIVATGDGERRVFHAGDVTLL